MKIAIVSGVDIFGTMGWLRNEFTRNQEIIRTISTPDGRVVTDKHEYIIITNRHSLSGHEFDGVKVSPNYDDLVSLAKERCRL